MTESQAAAAHREMLKDRKATSKPPVAIDPKAYKSEHDHDGAGFVGLI